MTRDDILRMAREAGLVDILEEHASEYGNGMFITTPYPELERFAALVAKRAVSNIDPASWMSWQEGYAAGAAAEREACAQIADAEASIEGIAQRVAASIRARGNT